LFSPTTSSVNRKRYVITSLPVTPECSYSVQREFLKLNDALRLQ
jgi:hypothetical protein